ncbi:MAG: hypothetical protein PHD36_04845 [Desulfotomaculaceae bacterium]|nr:hypothetical protein [Desulfotomaculaceae bacterium]
MDCTEKTTQIEDKVKLVYDLLKELSQVEDFPAIRANAQRALGTVWQMVNHLSLDYE